MKGLACVGHFDKKFSEVDKDGWGGGNDGKEDSVCVNCFLFVALEIMTKQ